MPNFRYIAINRDNKKVAGQITADTEDLARKELHRLGFSVLSMGAQEESQKKANTGVKNFEFEGTDKAGKTVKGTIEGTSELPVYRRLVEEYGFKVSYLADEYAAPEEKSQMRKQGLSDLQNLYLQSKKEDATQSRSLGKKIKDYFSGWLGKENEETKKMQDQKRRDEFIKQVDEATEKTKAFLNENAGRLVGQLQHDMQTALDHVVRIRNSNNEKNIRVATEDLLDLLQTAKKGLDMAIQAGETKIDYSRIEVNSNPEMQHTDETEAEYNIRLKNILRQKETTELLTGILKDFLMLITAPQRSVTWKRIGLKWDEYMTKHKQMREEEKARREQEEREKGAIQGRHPLAQFAWVWDEIHAFAGLLLFFYVLYFIIAGILSSKNLGIESDIFARTLESNLLRQMLLVTFIIYIFGTVYNLYINESRDRYRVSYWVGTVLLLVFFSVNI